MLRQLTQPKCSPVSLEQARKHLAVDTSDRSNDTLIEMLIESGTADSQMKTGRIWVESNWEWQPEVINTATFLQFPIVPVVDLKLYDKTIKDNPEPPIEDIENDDNSESGQIDDNKTKRQIAKRAARKSREANSDSPDSEQPVESEKPAEWPEVSADYVKVEYPSLDPMGYPAIGGITILQPFPEDYQLVLTVGYPVESKVEPIEQFDNPRLVLDKTGYAKNLIRLVFNRPVSGDIYISNFEVRKKYTAPPEPIEPEQPPIDEDDGWNEPNTRKRNTSHIKEDLSPQDQIISLVDVYFIDGAVEIEFIEGDISEGDSIQVSFFEGAIYDQFDNFVQPIIQQDLPPVIFISVDDFVNPDAVPEKIIYESLAPAPIKNWILTRVGSLYSQRTEIALRAGKSNDAMFPDQFINNLLDPYRVRFLTQVR